VQWVLSYVQRKSADVWKKNVIEELESGEVECKLAEEFLMSLKKEFGRGEEELVKAVELRKLEQEGRTIEEQERRGKTEREEGTGKRSPKIGETDNTMTISVAEKANAFLVGNNRACSNRGS